MDLRITKYSHYFAVFGYSARGREYRREASEPFIEMQLAKSRGRFVKQPKRIFARRDLEKEETCFPISYLEKFIYGAENFKFSRLQFEIFEMPVHEGVKVDFEHEITPWENQVPIIEFCTNDSRVNVVTAQPGFGKTLVSLASAAAIGRRFAVVTLGGYEDRWIPEFYDKLNLRPDEVRSCCGCVKLYRLLREVKDKGIDGVKAIFLSTATIRDFIKNWNTGKVIGSGCEDINPSMLWEFLGVGLQIVDEAHKEVHLHGISSLHSNIPKIIYLTATLFPNTEFMGEMYEAFFPKRLRMAGSKIDVYVDVVRVLYNLKDPQRAKVMGGQGSYSHTTYEAWLMQDAQRENRYYSAIYDYAFENWITSRKPEHKLLIFAATIEMCQKLTTFFLKLQPGLVINSFTSGDDYQILLDSDIIFSTIGKSGTAVDIPNLTQAYLTVAIDSPNANIQALGRLRELKGDKKFPQSYHCLVCLNIDKHLDYWKSKEKLFKGRIKGVRTAYLNQII